jgi:hypothetical protein
MPRISAVRRAQQAIFSQMDSLPRKAFLLRDLRTILDTNRFSWRLPAYFSVADFIRFLKTGQLTEVELKSDQYSNRTLYAWGNPSVYQVATAIHPEAYVCHLTAVFLHGLTEQIPATVYVNREQSEKPTSGSSLTQEAIDRAFSNAPRVSNYVFSLGDTRICIVSGKRTGGLEVGSLATPQGDTVPGTKLERTLIDIAVRPQYAGGVYQVLSAYRAARGKASSNTLLATLSRLKYTYPYHQAIGFYMWKAGFSSSALELMKTPGMQYDFYLANRIPEKAYVPEWRLFVPKGLETVD